MFQIQNTGGKREISLERQAETRLVMASDAKWWCLGFFFFFPINSEDEDRGVYEEESETTTAVFQKDDSDGHLACRQKKRVI